MLDVEDSSTFKYGDTPSAMYFFNFLSGIDCKAVGAKDFSLVLTKHVYGHFKLILWCLVGQNLKTFMQLLGVWANNFSVYLSC